MASESPNDGHRCGDHNDLLSGCGSYHHCTHNPSTAAAHPSTPSTPSFGPLASASPGSPGQHSALTGISTPAEPRVRQTTTPLYRCKNTLGGAGVYNDDGDGDGDNNGHDVLHTNPRADAVHQAPTTAFARMACLTVSGTLASPGLAAPRARFGAPGSRLGCAPEAGTGLSRSLASSNWRERGGAIDRTNNINNSNPFTVGRMGEIAHSAPARQTTYSSPLVHQFPSGGGLLSPPPGLGSTPHTAAFPAGTVPFHRATTSLEGLQRLEGLQCLEGVSITSNINGNASASSSSGDPFVSPVGSSPLGPGPLSQRPAPGEFDALIDQAYGYFLDRGNGVVTRLVPADMLPPETRLAGVTPTQMRTPGPGMVVLPSLGGAAPLGTWDGRTPLTLDSSYNGIQVQIDRIIGGAAPPPTRPKKVWCDKWIHDGKCAFTQQGCKFRHEMPSDPATLEMLGLFSGPPVWYMRRQVAEAKSRQAGPNDVGPGPVEYRQLGPTTGGHAIMPVVRPQTRPWRGQFGMWAHEQDAQQNHSPDTTSPGLAMTTPGQPVVRCQWGPIAPPARQPRGPLIDEC